MSDVTEEKAAAFDVIADEQAKFVAGVTALLAGNTTFVDAVAAALARTAPFVAAVAAAQAVPFITAVADALAGAAAAQAGTAPFDTNKTAVEQASDGESIITIAA